VQQSLLGGEGKDLIVFDKLSRTTVTASGGNGADTFQFSNNNFFSGPYTLTIADFDAAGGDKLDLLALLPADLGANPFGTAGFLKAEQSGSDVKLYFDSDGAARTTYGYTLIARWRTSACPAWCHPRSSVGWTLAAATRACSSKARRAQTRWPAAGSTTRSPVATAPMSSLAVPATTCCGAATKAIRNTGTR
jgi:hypothetical protein